MTTSRLHLLAAALVMLLAAPPSGAWAASGGVAYLPFGNKRKSKVEMDVDTRWVDSNGYRPIRVTVRSWPPGPAPADRQFRVTLSADNYGMSSGTTVTDIIELPQGQRSVTKSIAFPQSSHYWRIHVKVREDGVDLPDLESDLSFPQRRGYGSWTESVPSLLFLDSDAPSQDDRQTLIEKSNKMGITFTPGEKLTIPDLRNLSVVFPDIYGNRPTGTEDVDPKAGVNDTLILKSIHDANKQELLAPAEMPTRWIEWTCFDVVFISLADLQQMAAKTGQPQQYAALRDWLRAGGTLCVYGTGDKYARVPELEKLLALEPQPTLQTDANKAPRDSAWKPPKESDIHAAGLKAELELTGGYGYTPTPMPTAQTKKAKSKKADKATSEAPIQADPPYLTRNVVFGKLAVFAKEDPFPGKSNEWRGLFNALGAEHWMWYRRHGMSLTRENHSYWEFLIPGVGKAPVLSFLFIITLFMLVIGPLNYSWLKRRARLQFLLVTVPAGAGVMVAGLFIFALATDGLSVRSRVRSYTQLDQQGKHAVSWSRQTYYAALAPSRGLMYPETAAVYQLEAEPVGQNGRRQGARALDWDEGQRLRAGYIFPRTASQFLVIDAEPSEAKLEVKAKGSDVNVVNHLGSPISLLILRDEEGKIHVGNDLPAGDAHVLKAITSAEAFEQWARKVRVDHPELPTDWSVSNDNLFSWMGMPRGYYGQIDPQAAATSQASSLLERGLDDGDAGGFLDRLPPRSYLACTADPVATPLGLTRTQVKASLHVTFGKW